MSHTNGQIPDRYSSLAQLRKRVADLEHELNYVNGLYSSIEKEFYNVPEAVKQYGYVDLHDASGRLIITLVEKTAASDKGE